jgi:hypothetical protein
MEGRSELALRLAREMAAMVDTEVLRQRPLTTLQHYWITPVYALVRFGRWNAVLERDMPASDLVYPRAVLRYARGMAHTRKGNLDAAARELEALDALRDDERLKWVTVWDINKSRHILEIARHVLAGELAAARGNFDVAVVELEAAVASEDALNYDEPPSWHYPVRQSLGAVLLVLVLAFGLVGTPFALLVVEWDGLVPPSADPASCGLCTDRPGVGRDALTLRTVGFSIALFGLYAGLVLVVRIFGARIPDRIGWRRGSTLALTAVTLGIGLIAAWGAVGSVWAGAVGLGVGMSLLYPSLFTAVMAAAPEDERTHAVGTFSVFFDLSQGLGATIVGAVVSVSSERGGFGAAGALALAGLAAQWMLRGRIGQRRAVAVTA